MANIEPGCLSAIVNVLDAVAGILLLFGSLGRVGCIVLSSIALSIATLSAIALVWGVWCGPSQEKNADCCGGCLSFVSHLITVGITCATLAVTCTYNMNTCSKLWPGITIVFSTLVFAVLSLVLSILQHVGVTQ